jgi:hypothetical protein
MKIQVYVKQRKTNNSHLFTNSLPFIGTENPFSRSNNPAIESNSESGYSSSQFHVVFLKDRAVETFKSEASIKFRNSLDFYGEMVDSRSPIPRYGVPPIIGCPQLLIKFMRSGLLRMRHAIVLREIFRMETDYY